MRLGGAVVAAMAAVAVTGAIGMAVPSMESVMERASAGVDDPGLRMEIVESIPLGVYLQHNGTIVGRLIDMINGAQHNFSMSAFYMDLTTGNASNGGTPGQQVFDALVNAVDRGVNVRIAVTSAGNGFPMDDAFKLQQLGVDVRYLDFQEILGPNGGVLHTKLYLADTGLDGNAGQFILASANADWKSFTQVKELGLHGWNSSTLASQLQQVFETYWTIGATNSTPSTWPSDLNTPFNLANPMVVSVNDSAPSSLVVSQSPPPFEPPGWEDDLKNLLDVVANAGDELNLEVMDYWPAIIYQDPKLYWAPLDTALRTAAYQSNTSVRFLIGYWEHTEPEMVDFVRSLNDVDGIEVKLFEVPAYSPPIPFTRVNHAKWAVSSNHLFVTTSNWSGDYFVNTAGASISTQDANLRAIAKSIFDRDWYSEYTHDIPPPSAVLPQTPRIPAPFSPARAHMA